MGLSGLFTKSKKIWSSESLHCSNPGKGCVPCARRISILDGLYAGEFPAVFEGAVSDYLQLQLSAG